MVELSDLAMGEQAKVLSYKSGNRHYRRQLLGLGLIPGTVLTVIGIAPLGDPIQISLRGTAICLRKDEATIIELEKILT